MEIVKQFEETKCDKAMSRTAKAFLLAGNYWEAKEWIVKAIKVNPSSTEYRALFKTCKFWIEKKETQQKTELTGFLSTTKIDPI